MAKRYKVTWCDVTEYECEIEANSREEAEKKFHNDGPPCLEPTGYVQLETDSVVVEEIT